MSRHRFDDDEPYVVIERHESSIAPFLIGAAVGAGLALLLAPRSGEATRGEIKRRALGVRRAARDAVSGVKDNMTGRFDDARRRVEERIDSARDAIDLRRRQFTRAVDAGRAAARETRSEMEERLAERKAAFATELAENRGSAEVETATEVSFGRPSRPAVSDDDTSI